MGTTHYPLTQQIADTISVHGLAWAVQHYSKKVKDPVVLRTLFRSAYL